MLNVFKNIIITMRLKQWVKNVFIFAGLIFSRNLFQVDLLARVSAGFILFSLVASSVYIFNDIQDIEKDRQHPEKRKRPLPAGLISLRTAYVFSIPLAVFALAAGYLLDKGFFAITAAYVVMNIAYSLKIKDIVILDVMFIAFGFVIRVLAGTILADVQPSDWLIMCTITISLFLGFSKRRHELSLMGNNSDKHRNALTHYSIPFLDQMIAVATACTVMFYALYTTSEETVARFGTRNLLFTIPFVLYGIYRYLYLIHQKAKGGNPTSAVLTDLPLIVAGIIWLIVVITVIY